MCTNSKLRKSRIVFQNTILNELHFLMRGRKETYNEKHTEGISIIFFYDHIPHQMLSKNLQVERRENREYKNVGSERRNARNGFVLTLKDHRRGKKYFKSRCFDCILRSSGKPCSETLFLSSGFYALCDEYIIKSSHRQV